MYFEFIAIEDPFVALHAVGIICCNKEYGNVNYLLLYLEWFIPDTCEN